MKRVVVPVLALAAACAFAQTQIGHIPLEGSIVEQLVVEGEALYVLAASCGDAAPGLAVVAFDIRDPAAPKELGRVTLPSAHGSMIKVRSMLYVDGCSPEWADDVLYTVAMDNPAVPVVRGRLDIAESVVGLHPHSSSLGLLDVAYYDRATQGYGLLVIDVSNPSAPEVKARLSDTESLRKVAPLQNGYAVDSVNRSTDYSRPDVALTVSDAAGKPVTPAPVPLPGVGWTFDSYVTAGSFLYGLITGEGWVGYITAIDFSRPAAPKLLTNLECRACFPASGIRSVTAGGGFLYVFGEAAGASGSRLQVYKLKADDLRDPKILALREIPVMDYRSFSTNGLISGNLLAFGVAEEGVFVFRLE